MDTPDPDEKNPSPAGFNPIFWPILMLGLGLIAAGTVDLPVARWSTGRPLPGELDRLIRFGETFGHALGVAVILLGVWVLDPKSHRRFPRLIACSFGAGLVATIIKLFLSRTRPRAFDLDSSTIADSFVGWFTFGAGGSAQQSFPSSHTATAFGLALALSWLYPHARYYFAALAVLVAVQRFYSQAHFVSDTCTGAAVGLITAAIVLNFAPCARRFERFEGR
jgi:membrane-associated phospholipid phosphatase